ncbi:MAG TPA: pantoate--beta-alanine ligase [Rhodospirillales bacterium]|nr:pantoate--beta-alanine ligase [Rhodospirillales bacterium]
MTAAEGGRGAARVGIARTVADLRRRVQAWREERLSVALVPTMGALHDGHLSLIRLALTEADRVCVSLFVNPTQFGPNEDFDRYPRDEAADTEKIGAAGAHLLFAPEGREIYPPGHLTRIQVPGLGDDLEGAFRLGFFTDVATVVAKLLLMALPDVAIFGAKDYQQLQVIRRMVADLDIPVRILGGETVREPDGLALSSRNAYLAPAERRIAPALHAAIVAVARSVASGADAREAEANAARGLIAAGLSKVDYVAVRDAETLEPWPGAERPGRVLAAAWLGRTRLIDNVAIPT